MPLWKGEINKYGAPVLKVRGQYLLGRFAGVQLEKSTAEELANRPASQPVRQSVRQSVSQSLSQSANQPVSQPVSQAVSHSVSQSTSQPTRKKRSSGRRFANRSCWKTRMTSKSTWEQLLQFPKGGRTAAACRAHTRRH